MTDNQAPKSSLAEYIKDPNHCPFCLASDVEGGGVTFEGVEVLSGVSCLSCSRTWTDIFTLTGLLYEEGSKEKLLK